MAHGGYIEELELECKQTDPNSHASRLIAQEIERLKKGDDEIHEKKGFSIPVLDLHTDRPTKVAVKIRLPVKDFPRYNFVGKLLGPKGHTLKALQEQTGCKMAIMGRGSMRDKDKEEELRKEGGKYAHLDEELHVLVECYSELVDGYSRLIGAFEELKKFINPQIHAEMYGGGEGGGEAGGMNGASRGRGGFRGGPPAERGGRGAGFRGGRGGGPPVARGGPGGPPPPRGAPRGGAGRGGPPPSRGGGRGASQSNSSYDGYGSQGYGSGGYDSGYDGYGTQNYSSGNESQYYDYGHSTGQGSNYDSYSGYDYGDSWNTGGGKAATPSGRGGARGQGRSHPYQRS